MRENGRGECFGGGGEEKIEVEESPGPSFKRKKFSPKFEI